MTNPSPEPRVERPTEEPASHLIDVRQLARMLQRSIASLERDQAAGRLPAQLYVGGSRRWRRAEIEAWVIAGCPVRKEWETLLAAQKGVPHVA